MQLPLIKDGLVVNVVEIEEGTLCCSKAEHKHLGAAEVADYEARAAAWRAEIAAHHEAIRQAELQHFMACGVAAAAKDKARQGDGNSAQLLKHVLTTDEEAAAYAANLTALRATSLPDRPAMHRARRWIMPDDHIIGPPGGNIGDTWDGKSYIAPEGKTASEKAVD
jgi:hypothetical protein